MGDGTTKAPPMAQTTIDSQAKRLEQLGARVRELDNKAIRLEEELRALRSDYKQSLHDCSTMRQRLLAYRVVVADLSS